MYVNCAENREFPILNFIWFNPHVYWMEWNVFSVRWNWIFITISINVRLPTVKTHNNETTHINFKSEVSTVPVVLYVGQSWFITVHKEDETWIEALLRKGW